MTGAGDINLAGCEVSVGFTREAAERVKCAKSDTRFNVVIGEGQEDTLGSFILRTTSFNSIRTLAARLQYFSAVSGERLACLPLELKRGVSPRR